MPYIFYKSKHYMAVALDLQSRSVTVIQKDLVESILLVYVHKLR